MPFVRSHCLKACLDSRRGLRSRFCTQFTCFTGTKVQILTPKELRAGGRCSGGGGGGGCHGGGGGGRGEGRVFVIGATCRREAVDAVGTQFTCFTGTKVQILALLGGC
jgi:hypothetical protein